MKSNKGFTLIELLVVVLIIGILAAIAVPQYQKTVLKANLHKGVSFVGTLYEAQQSYYLANGKFANNLTDLDVSLPNGCTDESKKGYYMYVCDFGKFYSTGFYSIYFLVPDESIAYIRFLEDHYNSKNDYTFKAGHNYCNARPYSQAAQEVCENMGGIYLGENPNIWKYYALD